MNVEKFFWLGQVLQAYYSFPDGVVNVTDVEILATICDRH